jgi:hypothetical protein
MYILTDYRLILIKDWQKTDPTFRQRGRPERDCAGEDQKLKMKSEATALNTVLASEHIQMT